VFFGRFLSSAHIITSVINEELRTPSANQAANTIVDSNNNYNNNTMAATYDIVSIGETDASALTRIGYKAFADDLLNLRLYNLQDATPSQIENDLQWRIQRNEKRMYGPGGHWFKAINTATGKAVGYCGILAPEKGKPKGLDTTDDTIKLPETMNQDLWAVVGAKGKELREQHMGNRDDYWCKCIHYLFLRSVLYISLTVAERCAVNGSRSRLSRPRYRKATLTEAMRDRRRGWTRHIS
jgi:hypothetical protein